MKRNIYTISLVFRFLNVCDILVGELLPTLATARRLRLNG